jgi:hypothetical protein
VRPQNIKHAYRVMSKEEYKDAKQGQWADGPLVQGDPAEMGSKWLWKTKTAARSWYQKIIAMEPDILIARVPTTQEISTYVSRTHVPEGIAVHVPIPDLGRARWVK